jgi:hypothetical protein
MLTKAGLQKEYRRRQFLRTALMHATNEEKPFLLERDLPGLRVWLREKGLLAPDGRQGKWKRAREKAYEEKIVRMTPEEVKEEVKKKEKKGKHETVVERWRRMERAKEGGRVGRGEMERGEWEKKWGPWPDSKHSPEVVS